MVKKIVQNTPPCLSLVLLKSSTVESPEKEHRLFEESIYLYKKKENLSDKRAFFQEIKLVLEKEEMTYQNGYGELVTWKIEHILDVYEVEEKLSFEGTICEVYSRFLELPKEATVKEVVQRFYSDFVWF